MKILIVDDNEPLARSVRLMLQGAGHEAYLLFDPPTVTHIDVCVAQNGPFDVIISDYEMTHFWGDQVLCRIAGLLPEAGRILYTAAVSGDRRVVEWLVKQCPPGTVLLAKPANEKEFAQAIRQALEAARRS